MSFSIILDINKYFPSFFRKLPIDFFANLLKTSTVDKKFRKIYNFQFNKKIILQVVFERRFRCSPVEDCKKSSSSEMNARSEEYLSITGLYPETPPLQKKTPRKQKVEANDFGIA